MTHLLKNRWAKYLVQALAVALVIAGTVFYIAGQKSITISVDGESKVVTTRAATVASVLEQQDIALGERDEISVATDAPVVDAQKIEIKRNKSVQVNLDGTERVVHTTGMTVADWWGVSGRTPNAYFLGTIDDKGFFDLLTERIARL